MAIEPFNESEWELAHTDKIAGVKACRIRTNAPLALCVEALRKGGLMKPDGAVPYVRPDPLTADERATVEAIRARLDKTPQWVRDERKDSDPPDSLVAAPVRLLAILDRIAPPVKG